VQSLQLLSAAQLSESVHSPIAPAETAQLKIGITGTLAHGDRVAGQDNAMEDHGSSAAESPSSSPCGCSSKQEAAPKREQSPAQKKSNGEERSASAQRKEDSALVPTLGNECAPPPQRPVQRTIDDDLQNLEEDYQSTDDPLLKRLLAEARTLSDVEFRSENDPEQGHAARTVIGDRREHEVVLDPRITDPLTRQSLLLHELIHVSSDRKYNANSIGEPDPGLTSWVDPSASKAEQLREIGRQNRYRYSLAEHLDKVVDGDWAIDEQIARFVKDRLRRVMGASHREFDSVLTELYYVLKKKNVDERTDTFQEVAAMAAAAYRTRNEGVPLDQAYKEPHKTGFLS
jgi:hypothetical protein